MEPPVHDLLRRLDQLSDQFRELREGVEKAVRVADVDPEMALTRARKVLELVVRDVYERHVKEPPGTRPLENLLQRLVKDGHLPPRLEAYANTVRMLGNVGTHRFGEAITPADVYQSLTQLMPILEWYFQAERPEALGGRSPVAPPDRPAPPPAREAAPPPARPQLRRPGCSVSLAVTLSAVLVAAGVTLYLVQTRTTTSPEPLDTGTTPPADPFEKSKVERERSVLFLDGALPLYTGDKLHVTCALPAGVQAALFWLDSEGRLQELTAAEVADGRLQFPAGDRVVPLKGPPGTEFLLVCGGRSGKPRWEEVQAFLGAGPLPPLPDGVKDVRLGRREVAVEIRRAPGTPEPSATGPVVERLEALRRGLAPRYDFVAGLALPHRQAPAGPPAADTHRRTRP